MEKNTENEVGTGDSMGELDCRVQGSVLTAGKRDLREASIFGGGDIHIVAAQQRLSSGCLQPCD